MVALWRDRRLAPKADRAAATLAFDGASEAAFKAGAPGRRVLHLATHGFFLGGKCESALDATRGATRASETGSRPPLVTGENPLVLSGLALAGANDRDAAGPDEEDGILTAQEVASLDLSGVWWGAFVASGDAR